MNLFKPILTKQKNILFLILLAFFLLGEGILVYKSLQIIGQPAPNRTNIISAKKEELDKKTLLFVGDIMLDRGVEYLMKKNSFLYPFEKMREFSSGIDIVFGNLEGPIVKNPKTFPAGSLMFAFHPDTIKGLLFGNFNVLSLANNHTLNMGKEGLAETKEFLKKANIDFVGDPVFCPSDLSLEIENIIFLAINVTFPFNCNDEEIVETIEAVKSQNPKKFFIVSLHWGQEYQFTSSLSQQNLAHKIIDAGGDLIIGAHPHVIQEVEKYKGKLVFYSLGNFILDQYFSEETQQGLAVELEIYPEKLIYRLLPTQSHLSQPLLMGQKQAKELLDSVAQRSSVELSDEIKKGIIEIER